MGPAPHKSSAAYRPWLVIGDDTHPFAHTECLCLALSTQEHPQSIEIPDGAWVCGGSREDAYASPWYVTTMKHRDLDDQQGTLSNDVLESAVDALHRYTSARK